MGKPRIEQDTDETMREIAADIEAKTGPNYGFMVLVFPLGSGNRAAQYISNCRREGMINILREKANALEARLDIPAGKVIN